MVDYESLLYADDGVHPQAYHAQDTIVEEFKRAGLLITSKLTKVYYPWELTRRFDYGYFPDAEEEIWDWFVVAKKNSLAGDRGQKFLSPFYLHHLAILGTFVSSVHLEKNFLRIESNGIPSSGWSYCTPLTENGVNKIISDERKFKELYVPNFINNEILSAHLKANYNLIFTDAWMCWNCSSVPLKKNSYLHVKKVLTISDMEIFINVFMRAFGGTELQEPYGKLPPEFAVALYNSFTDFSTALTHFIAYDKDDNPIGCASVSLIKSCAFFYCLGVIPSYRCQGIATQLHMFRIKYALDKGCTDIYLQTEKDSINELINNKVGFYTAFSSSWYILK